VGATRGDAVEWGNIARRRSRATSYGSLGASWLYAAAKQEIDVLKAEGHIEFVVPAKTRRYRLAQAFNNQCGGELWHLPTNVLL
jgi:hypothetical protein